MNNKRILSIIAAGVMTLSLLSGCGKKAEPVVATTAPVVVETTAAAVAETTAAVVETKAPEVYKASSEFDERGWKGEIAVTYTDGKISKVEYMEVNKDGVKKSEDKAYAAMKVSPADAFKQLTEAAQKDDKAITVSGATGISTTFKTLYEKAKAMKK
jgi:major membrane immunogen (membrane-anchored lipoprotein)